LCSALGGVCPLVVCTKIANALHFRDPFSLRGIDVTNYLDSSHHLEYVFSNEEYWVHEFIASATRVSLQEFIVLDAEDLYQKGSKGTSLAEV
jgi:hypothetical protein